MKEVEDLQDSFGGLLIEICQLWDQLNDDLTLLGASSGRDQRVLQSSNLIDHSRGSVPSCSAEEMAMCRVLKVDSIQSSETGGSIPNAKRAPDLIHLYTLELLQSLGDAIAAQSSEVKLISNAYAEGDITLLSKSINLFKEKFRHLHKVIAGLHLKHKEYAEFVEVCAQNVSADQLRLKYLEVELEESMAELEESRRKIDTMKTQRDESSLGQELVSDRYKMLSDSLQDDRSSITWREKELVVKAELFDAARKAINVSNSKIEELEEHLHRCITENNELEIKAEEAIKDSGQKGIKAELQVMISTLSKKAGMVKDQLNEWKGSAEEALRLFEETRTLGALLDGKGCI